MTSLVDAPTDRAETGPALDTNAKDPRAAVDKAMSLLRAFGTEAWSGVGVSELARRADLSKSTAFRVLRLLERNGIVERAGSDFRLGGELNELCSVVYSPENRRICERVTPFLLDLYQATRLTVHLAVLHGIDVVYLHKLRGHQTIRCPSRIGSRAPAFCTAGGKVLLAHNSDALEVTIEQGLHRMTAWTITDPGLLRAELALVRRNGVGFVRQEAVPGLVCMAAPVLDGLGRPVAAISVSGDAERFDPSEHETILRQVAYSASRRMAAHTRSASASAAPTVPSDGTTVGQTSDVGLGC